MSETLSKIEVGGTSFTIKNRPVYGAITIDDGRSVDLHSHIDEVLIVREGPNQNVGLVNIIELHTDGTCVVKSGNAAGVDPNKTARFEIDDNGFIAIKSANHRFIYIHFDNVDMNYIINLLSEASVSLLLDLSVENTATYAPLCALYKLIKEASYYEESI